MFNKKSKSFYVLTFLMLFVCLSVGCVEFSDKEYSSELIPIDDEIHEFVFQDLDLVVYSEAMKESNTFGKKIYVEGNVTNNGDQPLSITNLKATFYDSNGSNISKWAEDSSTGSWSNIVPPGETVNFTVLPYETWDQNDFAFMDIESYKIIVS